MLEVESPRSCGLPAAAAHYIEFCQTGEDPRPDCMGPAPTAAPVTHEIESVAEVDQKRPLPLAVQDPPRTRTIGVGRTPIAPKDRL
jgi:hypothetical protein